MTKKHYPLLALTVYILLYLLPLGARPLFVPDEVRYGEVPREMIASGDWLVPRLDGLQYFEKPVLGYWLHAGSIMIFGENRFALRLPSALAVGLSALLVFLLVRHAVSRDGISSGVRDASLAVLIFLTCFEVVAVGTFTVLDSLLAFFLTATMTAFYFAGEAPAGSGREKSFLLLAGIACGLAFLTKGFLAFAVPVVALLPWLVWQGRMRDIFRMAWLPLLAAVLVALPWSILIHLREPDFWRFFFWNEHVRRFLADNAQHRESFWFFFITAPAMFLPWAFVMPAGIAGLKDRLQLTNARSRLLRFALCWLLFPFLFFSASSGKLLTYILPCFPPFAILMALGLDSALRQGRKRLFQAGVATMAGLFALLLVGLVGLQIFAPQDLHPYTRTWKWLMAANGLALMIFFCLRAMRSQRPGMTILSIAMAPVTLLAGLHFIMPDLTIEKKAPGPLLIRHRRDITPQTIIISGEEPLQAVCWFFQRRDVLLLGGAGELAYGLTRNDGPPRQLDVRGAAGIIRHNRGRTVLIARARNYRQWQEYLPEPIILDSSGLTGYVFAMY